MKRLEKHLALAVSAHNGTSFSPEKRGKYYIDLYSDLLEEDLKEVEKYEGDTERYAAKFEKLFVGWMHSKSNCISSMITGPSRFPTARAEKYNNWERNKSQALHDFREKAIKAIKKAHKKKYALPPLEEARLKLEQETKYLEQMKEANKVCRNKNLSYAEKLEILKRTFSDAAKILVPDYMDRIGFAPFSLTNCRNRIKNAEARVKELERRQREGAEETEREDGIKIVENVEMNRLQVFFVSPPDAEVRTKLKSNGFRWAPSHGAWQAYLNEGSRRKLAYIL